MMKSPGSIRRSVLCAVVGIALVSTSAAALADEVESTAAVGAAPAGPATHLFGSWFAGKAREAAKSDAARDATADTGDAAASAGTFGARASRLVGDALGLIGISYRMGGMSPSAGFDCSGLVGYVFQNAIGLSLPRRAEELSRVGIKVATSELKPGDLVFYKTLRKTFSHVGIYLGNNRFIHAPSTGGAVRIDDMTQDYWAARFNGARRVDG